MKVTSAKWRQYAFVGIWLAATIFSALQLSQRRYSFESPLTILNLGILFLCAVALLVWIPNPIREEPTEKPGRKGRFIFLVLVSIGMLFSLRTLVGPPLLFGLPVIAIIILRLLKQPITKPEIFYAASLALIAGVTGLEAKWITSFSPLMWGILQVFLVLTGLLTGWSILRYTNLHQQGVGVSRLLSNGTSAAFKSFMNGILIAMPWAFMNVLTGGGNGDTWVKAWWQPIIAIQPGIAEEAWGRIFLVPLLFLLFRRVGKQRTAFTAALFIIAYWFAYLHTPGGLDGIVSAVIIGTLYALPISYLCLYRDLETAIGWHFWVDFIKFVFALVLFNR